MNSARILARVGNAVVLVASGAYVFIYLYRWEWNRALLAGLVFVAAEIGMAAAVVGDRMRRLEARIDSAMAGRAAPGPRPARRNPDPDPGVLHRIREVSSPSPGPFQWLKPERSTELGVFVPILLGAGVVASAVAWAVERLAARTARPALEHDLASRLGALAWPDAPLGSPADPGWLGGPVPPATGDPPQ